MRVPILRGIGALDAGLVAAEMLVLLVPLVIGSIASIVVRHQPVVTDR